MEMLYDEVKNQPGLLLDSAVHELIQQARGQLDEAIKNIIYENRLLAETAISRPVMKAFKAMIREKGLLADAELDDDTENV